MGRNGKAIANGLRIHVGLAVTEAGRSLGLFEPNADDRGKLDNESRRWLQVMDRARLGLTRRNRHPSMDARGNRGTVGAIAPEAEPRHSNLRHQSRTDRQIPTIQKTTLAGIADGLGGKSDAQACLQRSSTCKKHNNIDV